MRELTDEAAVIAARPACRTVAAIPLICTVRLARVVLPELGSHSLDRVASRLGLTIPADRHRALPDAELTAQVFTRLAVKGLRADHWRTLLELQAVGGVYVRPEPSHQAAQVVQSELF